MNSRETEEEATTSSSENRHILHLRGGNSQTQAFCSCGQEFGEPTIGAQRIFDHGWSVGFDIGTKTEPL